MQEKQIDRTLLQSYIEGECNREQLTIVRRYLTDPEYQKSLEVFLQADWQQTAGEQAEQGDETREKYQQFLTAVQPGAVTPQFTSNRTRLFPVRSLWRAAAAILIVVIGVTFIWRNASNKTPDIQWLSLYNEAGERTVFFLPDSSKVYLSAASSLEYNTGYGVSNRDLRLKGEAYFIVNHRGDHSFAVTTGKITTVDIGTEFNIRFLNNSPAIEVGVAKGIVEVLNNTGKGPARITTLSGRQRLRFDTASRHTEVITLPEGEIGAWRQGLLVFRKQKLGEVAAELERYYGLSIRFANPDHARIVITTTLRNASAAEALEIMALTAGVKIERKGNDVQVL
jgi:transmembrane sensor